MAVAVRVPVLEGDLEALGEALSGVRVKYVLLPDARSVRLDIEMQEPTTGLNLADYLEKKDGAGGGG